MLFGIYLFSNIVLNETTAIKSKLTSTSTADAAAAANIRQKEIILF